MASGVKVSDEVKDVFEEMKRVTPNANQEERLRLAIFNIEKGQIVVQAKYTNKQCGHNVYEFFKGMLMNKCFYALYDCHYETKESPKDELVLVMWCPDSGMCKEKMHFSSSHGALKKSLNGVKNWIELHDTGDCQEDCFIEKLNIKNIISLEGKGLHSCK